MRRGAATSVRAPTWGAFVFACPSDDPLSIAVRYVAACLPVAGSGRLALPRPVRR